VPVCLCAWSKAVKQSSKRSHDDSKTAQSAMLAATQSRPRPSSRPSSRGSVRSPTHTLNRMHTCTLNPAVQSGAVSAAAATELNLAVVQTQASSIEETSRPIKKPRASSSSQSSKPKPAAAAAVKTVRNMVPLRANSASSKSSRGSSAGRAAGSRRAHTPGGRGGKARPSLSHLLDQRIVAELLK
jgi:hypothetical protein